MRTTPFVLAAAAAGAAGTAFALPAPAPAAAPAGQAKTVHGGVIARAPKTLAPGTRVPASQIIGQRVFTGAKRGVALVSRAQAQYPAVTADGGHTWKTDGPALHLDAAQAPLAVTQIGASGRRTVFAWGGGGNVVDVTTDGGRHWRRALWSFGLPQAVFVNGEGHLVALVDVAEGSAVHGPVWRYVSRDSGRTWRYSTTLGGG
jgi:hypothetical protein